MGMVHHVKLAQHACCTTLARLHRQHARCSLRQALINLQDAGCIQLVPPQPDCCRPCQLGLLWTIRLDPGTLAIHLTCNQIRQLYSDLVGDGADGLSHAHHQLA